MISRIIQTICSDRVIVICRSEAEVDNNNDVNARGLGTTHSSCHQRPTIFFYPKKIIGR